MQAALPRPYVTKRERIGAAAAQVFNELHGNEWSSLSALRECIGDVTQDADNPLMEVEMKRQRGGGETGEARPGLEGLGFMV